MEQKCDKHWGKINAYTTFIRKLQEERHLENIILKQSYTQMNAKVQAGLTWLRIGSTGRSL
jgi:hypothetical protein